MHRVVFSMLACGFILTSTALADRDIVLLSGNAAKVTILDGSGTILITDGDPEPFVFECYDPDLPNDPPATIEYIGISGTPNGPVTVKVFPGPGHTYGAGCVKKINLLAADTGTISGLKISGDLGDADPNSQDAVNVCNLSGNMDIGGDIVNVVEIDNVSANINVAGDVAAELHFEAITGNIHVTGDIDADVTIGASNNPGSFSGDLTVDGEIKEYVRLWCDYSDDIEVKGAIKTEDPNDPNHLARLHFGGDFSGTATIGDSSDPNDPNTGILNEGAIKLDGDLSGTLTVYNKVHGTIHSRQDAAGLCPMSGRIIVNGDLDGGRIYIDGGLDNGSRDDEILVTGTMSGSSAIAIDYNGYDKGVTDGYTMIRG